MQLLMLTMDVVVCSKELWKSMELDSLRACHMYADILHIFPMPSQGLVPLNGCLNIDIQMLSVRIQHP